LFVGRTSVWRVWFSVAVDGHLLNAIVDRPLDLTKFVADVGSNLTSNVRRDVTGRDDVTSVDWCLRLVISDVVSLLDFADLSRVITDAYRSQESGA